MGRQFTGSDCISAPQHKGRRKEQSTASIQGHAVNLKGEGLDGKRHCKVERKEEEDRIEEMEQRFKRKEQGLAPPDGIVCFTCTFLCAVPSSAQFVHGALCRHVASYLQVQGSHKHLQYDPSLLLLADISHTFHEIRDMICWKFGSGQECCGSILTHSKM